MGQDAHRKRAEMHNLPPHGFAGLAGDKIKPSNKYSDGTVYAMHGL